MRKFDAGNNGSYRGASFKGRKFDKRSDKGSCRGTGVVARDGESAESLIRRFKKVVELSGIMRELRRREHYLSPSQKKRDKIKKAEKRAKKEAQRRPSSAKDGE